MTNFEVAVQGCTTIKGLVTAFMDAGEVSDMRVVVISEMSSVLMFLESIFPRGFVMTLLTLEPSVSTTGRGSSGQLCARIRRGRDPVGKIIIISDFSVPILNCNILVARARAAVRGRRDASTFRGCRRHEGKKNHQ